VEVGGRGWEVSGEGMSTSRGEEEGEEEVFNHCKNDLKRHARNAGREAADGGESVSLLSHDDWGESASLHQGGRCRGRECLFALSLHIDSPCNVSLSLSLFRFCGFLFVLIRRGFVFERLAMG